jgi:DnaK suppressor protein
MYLTIEQLDTLKKSIESQRVEIISRMRGEQLGEDPSQERTGDEVDIATNEGFAATHDRLRDRDMKLLKRLDDALRWMDDEDYGICQGCGVEIGFKRLLARPAAKLCIECKEAEEQRERGYYHPRRRRGRAGGKDGE